MSKEDQNLYESSIRVQGKTLFVDVRENQFGKYLKLTEKNRTGKRSTILIPTEAINQLSEALEKATSASGEKLAAGKTAKKEPKSQKTSSAKPVNGARVSDGNAVFVRELSFDTTDHQLFDYFCANAAVPISANVLKRNNGKSRGMGVVVFNSPAEAELTVQKLDGTTLDGREIRCKIDRGSAEGAGETEKGEANPPRVKRERPAKPERNIEDRVLDPMRIYIRNLAYETTDEDISDFFGLIGHVESVDVLKRQRDGRSLGQAIVAFEDAEHATEAIERFNGKELNGRAITVREYYEN